MTVQALILDMDGVLIDSNPIHTQAWLSYLSQYDVDADSIMERMHGKRNDQIVRDLFGAGLTAEEVFAHGARKEALYREMMRPQLAAHLVAGLVPFLERYKALPLGVASNAEPANIAFVLDEGGIRQYFSAIVDGHQVEHPKPHPDIYLEAARRLGVAPEHCVVFEDSETGIRAAQAAGARVVAVRTTDAELPETELAIRDFQDPRLDEWLRRYRAS